ncbi:MAG: sulfite exporter TauE/SafE family protein [Bacillota bacterium]
MSATQVVLILAAGVVSGFVNTVGGGGSLVSLPALIFMGLPSAVANGTNRVALMVQSLVAVGYFRQKGFFYPRLSIVLGLPAVLGSILGAKIAISLSDELFNKVLAVVMLAVLALIILRPEKKLLTSTEEKNFSRLRMSIAALVFFGVGFYGGFIQAGVGFIIIASLTLITGMSLVKINSLKVFVNAIYILTSLLVFVFSGKVDWMMGFILAAGNAVGAYLGSAFTVSGGDKWIRVFLVVTVLLMSGKLFGLHKLLGF